MTSTLKTTSHRWTKWVAVAAATVALGSAQAAFAQHRGGGGGGGHWSGGGHSGMHAGGRTWNGGGHFDRGHFDGGQRGYWGGNRFYGSRWHGAPYFASFGLFLGAPYFWGPSYYPSYGYPAYVSYPTGVYYPAEGAGPETSYRYYCPEQGYYPAVQACPQGWQRILPERAPSY